jgi:transposase-like protein
VAEAGTEGIELTGPGGLLTGLTKQVLETTLDVELGERLGHDHRERSGSGNVHNGSGGPAHRSAGAPNSPPPRLFAGTGGRR